MRSEDAQLRDAAAAWDVHLEDQPRSSAGPVYNGVEFTGAWVPDLDACTGTGVTLADGLNIGGATDDDVLFQRNRFGAAVVCTFELPNDSYIVGLYFAETFRDGCGSNDTTRQVTVSLEDSLVDAFDIVVLTNGCAIDNPGAAPFGRFHTRSMSRTVSLTS